MNLHAKAKLRSQGSSALYDKCYEGDASRIGLIFFESFTYIPTALTAIDRNRRIQVYQASDG